ncbi:MAG TPA: LacI family DNA-binding transcriptional regulator [Lachnospiraceae bacterium]|nr:LacI family DNA-binding transcriptional regulator [Lachnospiraceae bacterium]
MTSVRFYGKGAGMVSIKEVADKAGVAISTVSKVLNNYPYVSEETKKKVRAAIHELNYVPNTIAAALSSKQTGRAAILLSLNTQTQAIDEITMQYLSGVLNQALALNIEIITIFLSMISHMTPEEITRYLQSQGITGLIICGISKDDRYLHQLIESQVFRCVVVDAPITNENTSYVWIDNRRAQYEVAKKTILENTCKRVLYIAGKKNGYVTNERLAGMRQLADELDLKLLVRDGGFSELKARKVTFRYAGNKDAVVCASDLMAIGAMNALTEMDIFRPVCGFDGITLMGYVGKQMNTVRQNFYNIGVNAVTELKRLFDGESGRDIVLPFELVKLYYRDIIC